MHVFVNSPDGADPNGSLVQGRDGDLYGATQGGGANTCTYLGQNIGCGTIYKIDPLGYVTILHNFNGTDGFSPRGVTLGRDGSFYGAADQGGAYGFGTLFRLTAGGVFTKLHDFANSGDGAYPQDPLLQASDGNFYGLTQTGLYRATPSGTITGLYKFLPYPVSDNSAPLIQAADGDLRAIIPYGYYGHAYFCGSILRVSLHGKLVSALNFGCGTDQSTGNFPFSALTQALDGNFYGTNTGGGSTGGGTAFQVNSTTNVLTVLHNYTVDSGPTYAGLTQGSDGNFYGVVLYSTQAYSGTVDQLTLAGGYTEVGDLPYNGEDFPYWSLTQRTDGTFYGSSFFEQDSPDNFGSIYSFDNGLGPFITFVGSQGSVGSTVQILGQGLKGTSSVKFNGVPASSFSVLSQTNMMAVVPTGATSGLVTVTTPSRTLSSNKNFTVTH